MNLEQRTAELVVKRERVGKRTERLWAKGEFRDFDVYRVPVALLRLNPANRRFRAEREAFERDLGRPLDPETRPLDERSIISLLLDDDPRLSGEQIVGVEGKDARTLREDWDRRKQERPLWARPDGLVPNGNRRLAMLKRQVLKHGTAGYDHVDVIFLDPDDFDDAELFDMEAREQLTTGLKVRYSDLNLLLTLKDAADQHAIDWSDPRSIDEVGRTIHQMVGETVTYTRIQLHAVRYMGEYLKYIERPGEYRRLNRMVERFRDVGKNMASANRNAARFAPDLLELMFSSIQAGAKHGHLRELRRVLEQDPSRFEQLVAEVRGIEDTEFQPSDEDETEREPVETQDETEGEGTDPASGSIADNRGETDDLEDDDEDDEVATPDATPPGYPAQNVMRAVTLAIDEVNAATDEDSQKHVRAAATALARVPAQSIGDLLAEAEGHRVADAVRVISAWAEEAIKAVDEEPGDAS
jgi:hypothetical protein